MPNFNPVGYGRNGQVIDRFAPPGMKGQVIDRGPYGQVIDRAPQFGGQVIDRSPQFGGQVIDRNPAMAGQVIDRGAFGAQQMGMLPNWLAYLNYGRR